MSYKVLVVEAQVDVRSTLRTILQTAGYLVIEAATGEDALSTVRWMVPDAVILDPGQLPGIDGWLVLATIRREHLLPDTPIVITSAETDLNERVRANEFDCAEFLSSPFSAAELCAVMERVTMDGSPPAAVMSLGRGNSDGCPPPFFQGSSLPTWVRPS